MYQARLLGQHFIQQEIHNQAVVAALEGANKLRRVLFAQGQASQLQTNHPALGLLFQQRDCGLIYICAGCPGQDGADFGRGQAQIGGPHFQ